jgi:hypothetical protein
MGAAKDIHWRFCDKKDSFIFYSFLGGLTNGGNQEKSWRMSSQLGDGDLSSQRKDGKIRRDGRVLHHL